MSASILGRSYSHLIVDNLHSLLYTFYVISWLCHATRTFDEEHAERRAVVHMAMRCCDRLRSVALPDDCLLGV